MEPARVVAKLSFRVAGPPNLMTNSEVATMAYVRCHTSIPVPKVLDWNSDTQNPVGAEYIIMEHVSGVQLHEVLWPNMDSHQHMLVTKSLAHAVAEMANLKFPVHGSLYLAANANTLQNKVDLADGFVIGPNCGREYWDWGRDEASSGRNECSTNQGPWNTLEEYTGALLDAGYMRLPKLPTAEHAAELPYRSTVEEHVRLLQISKAVIKTLIQCPLTRDLSAPLLLHPDFNKRNLYVSPNEPTKITAVIDWQSTCIEPTFYANESPDLITPPPALSSISEMDDELRASIDDPKDREKLARDHWICQRTFEVVLGGHAPKLAAARALDETLLRTIRWSELGLPGSCRYQPSAKELAEHAKQWEDFETVQKFKLFLINAGAELELGRLDLDRGLGGRESDTQANV
ncbi:hypothetical protein PV04_10180 [Phialophora macrospora]|uniref:Altered inheritance of mitochondria protein 9, mitochondrial n=1 Tax=Phialophora macrospora TaxID=1851006 RepID=A0A0D2CDY9_9EURO|nr:hypothetical protein PV04_10180 [Phialophora macrospora]